MEKFILNRTVTRNECDWLFRDFKKGETVYKFTGNTYGCVSYLGIACTLDQSGGGEFFELPSDAITGFSKEEEKELQQLVTKIKYKQPTTDDMERADELTRKKWKSEGIG